tara:strand:- start:7271 stop:8038 length:768 start_codon:yes stop_codon:yes gene_type:complete
MNYDYCLVIKTNSAYAYLWPIINDLTKTFKKVYVLLDDNSNNFIFNKNIICVKYDINDTYATRLYKFILNIDYSHIILVHDVDLILNFNFKKINEYFELIKSNNIDRLSLGVFNGNDVIYNNNITLCKLYPDMSKNYLTPFDYAPSIYNKNFLLSLYSTFKEESYKTMEINNNVQNFIFNNFKSYGIQNNSNLKLIYHRGFVYTKDFDFLHITVKGKFLREEAYYDLKDTFIKFKNLYNLSFIDIDTFVPAINKL